MTNSQVLPLAGRLVAGLVLVATTACATSGTRITDREQVSAMLDSLASADAPRVTVSTESDFASVNRILTRLRVDESAYVAVVNVSPAGYAKVIFPEQPDEPAFLQGGRTYVIPGHFTGYQWASAVPPVGALGSRFVWYGRSHFAQISAQGPGYIFVIAARTPLDLKALAVEGYFDGFELGSSLADFDPETVVPMVAMVALGETRRGGVSVDYARYAGYDRPAFASSAFRSSYNSMYCGAGYDGVQLRSFNIVSGWSPGSTLTDCSELDTRRYRQQYRRYLETSRPVPPPVKPAPPDSGSATPPVRRPVGPGQRPPTGPDTLGSPRSPDDRRIVTSLEMPRQSAWSEPVTQEDPIVLTREERQRAVSDGRMLRRPDVTGDRSQPDARWPSRTMRVRPDAPDVGRPTTGSSAGEPARSTPRPESSSPPRPRPEPSSPPREPVVRSPDPGPVSPTPPSSREIPPPKPEPTEP